MVFLPTFERRRYLSLVVDQPALAEQDETIGDPPGQLEVILMRGRSDYLQAVADRMLALRGVKQGGIEIVPSSDAAPARARPRRLAGTFGTARAPDRRKAAAVSSNRGTFRGEVL